MRPDSRDLATVEPEDGDRSIGRRDFLKISGAGLAGTLLLGSVAVGARTAGAQNRAPSDSLMEEFREAAKEYGVPVGVLVAMGYVNTRWEMPSPGASDYEKGDPHGWGGYGIMALVKNPSTDTLGEAADLTGIPEDELKTERKANIMGGAALLAKSQRDQGRSVFGQGEMKRALEQGGLDPGELDGWLEAVSGRGAFTALGASGGSPAAAGVGGGAVYADQLSEVLKSGASGETKAGERIRLESVGGS